MSLEKDEIGNIDSSDDENDTNQNKVPFENDPENTMKVMIATDIHLGYGENLNSIKQDSFVTFEEILQIARKERVEAIFLSGDLFHENKPSRNTMYKAMKLIRKYCMGDDAIRFNVVSDQKVNFESNMGRVNFKDPNYNISLPIFSIHGNHDDPIGENPLSPMDLLGINNLVNYFGKSTSVENVLVRPVLIKKGSTKIALYGLGYIRDERLNRIFQNKKVTFFRPSEEQDDWFNLLLFHQNRVQHTGNRSNIISEDMLRGFLDLVIWGHEHEQNITPYKTAYGYDIIQPGSSIACSLSSEETKQKKVCVIEINGKNYSSKNIDLKTVRPFIYKKIVLSENDDLETKKNDKEAISEYLEKFVEKMIKKAKKKDKMPDEFRRKYESSGIPLIRLKVDYSGGYESLNPQKFGQIFAGRVANPGDMIVFHRKRETKKRKKKKGEEIKLDIDIESIKEAGANIDMFIKAELDEHESSMKVLNQRKLNEAVNEYVVKQELHSIEKFAKNQLRTAQVCIIRDSKRESKSEIIEEHEVDDLIYGFKVQIDNPHMDNKDDDDDDDEDDENNTTTGISNEEKKKLEMLMESSEEEEKEKKTKRGRKKKTSTKTKAKTKRTRKKSTKTTKKKQSKRKTRRSRRKDSSEDEFDVPDTPEPDDDYNPLEGVVEEEEEEEEMKKLETINNDDEDDDEDDIVVKKEEDIVVKKEAEEPKRRRRRRTASVPLITIDSDDEDEVPKSQKRRRRTTKKISYKEEDSDDEIKIVEPEKKKRKKTVSKKKKKKKKIKFIGLSDDEEEKSQMSITKKWSKKK